MITNPLISAYSGNQKFVLLHKHVSTQWPLSLHMSTLYVLCGHMSAQYAQSSWFPLPFRDS